MVFGRPVRLHAAFLLSTVLLGLVPVTVFPGGPRGWDLVVEGCRGARRFPLPAGTFALSWTHSVERTEWRESYCVDREGEIVLVASEFSSGGAGLPDAVGEGETFVQKDGRMRIGRRHVLIGELKVRLSGISHHFLWVGGERLDLNEAFGEGVVAIHAAPQNTDLEGGQR
jgi:hypothetical protein